MSDLISPLIQKIANDVLTKDKLEEASELVNKSQGKNNGFAVIENLWTMLKYQTPDSEINGKQLDYATNDLEDLANLLTLGKQKFEFKTRSLVFALANSIEVICKVIWREHDKVGDGDFIYDDPKKPLGSTLDKLSKNNVLDKNTLNILFLFNYAVWNENKHDVAMIYPIEKDHFFTVPDAILLTFIVNALTRKLILHFHFNFEWKCDDWEWKNTSVLIDEMDKNREK